MQRALMLALALLLPQLAARAQETNAVRLANLRHLAQWDARQARSEGVSFTRRGVAAFAGARRVEVLAEACGLAAKSTVEFALAGETSDRAYESLALSFARAGDIAAALESIGVPRGLNSDARAQRFWPRGERIFVTVRSATNDAAAVPLESHILDMRTQAPLSQHGFVYCGSARRGAEAGGGLRADLEPPMSIISMYNEPQSLLDVPRLAAQGEVYENFVVHPERPLPPGALLCLTFTPEPRADGKPRVLPVAIAAAPAAAGEGMSFRCALAGEAPMQLSSLAEVVKLLLRQVEAARDPYLTISFDDALPQSRAREICAALQMIEGEKGVRLEPPPPGQIFYKSFLPDEKWRERRTRLSQPWELHVGAAPRDGGAPSLKLVQILEDWSDPESLDPKLTVREHPLKDAAELPVKIRELGGGLPVLLIYAPAAAPLGDFMPAVRLVRESQPIVYVFAEP